MSRSRTYIMVPRDVPPENFVTVQETRKVERVGLARCLLPPCLALGALLLLAGLLTALACLLALAPTPAPDPGAKLLWAGEQGDEAVCGEGEWGVVGCSPCLCSPLGSSSPSCDRASGQCSCRGGHGGHKCDICPQVGPQFHLLHFLHLLGSSTTSTIFSTTCTSFTTCTNGAEQHAPLFPPPAPLPCLCTHGSTCVFPLGLSRRVATKTPGDEVMGGGHRGG